MHLRPLPWLAAVAFAAGVLAVPSPARAQGPVIEVEVGQTKEVEVGFARGLICDDLTVIDAELRDKNAQTNALFVTGKKVGSTYCRVGTDPLHIPRFVYEIHVIAAGSTPVKPAPAPTKPAPKKSPT